MSSRETHSYRWWGGALLVAATLAAYANSFSGSFVFDDRPSILENQTIRQLWPPWEAFAPPGGHGLTVEGRPLVNFTLALNYALGGLGTGGYHAFNLAIHVVTALLLFGVVRRTLVTLNERRSTALALATALLWAVHPLQTESVTYIVQRTESLMGMLFLLTLYAFIRGAECQRLHKDAKNAAAADRWFAVSFFACALGMATKEVMVSAPIMVFLYDRTFVSGSFRVAWERHRQLHLALAATWVALAFLVSGAGNRGGTIGASAGLTPWQYALCQARALVHYVRLALWPSPLIFDYGSDYVSFWTAAPYGLLDLAAVVATVRAVWRGSPWGFLGAWFFVILAPTTSVVGGSRQMLAEHRMYLSLAAVTFVLAAGARTLFGERRRWLLAALVPALMLVTLFRNTDYRSEIAIYADTAVKRPNNAHARYNFGKQLSDAGRMPEAIAEYEAAVRLPPPLAIAEYNLANALTGAGRTEEAIAHYNAAIVILPHFAKAHYNLGNALRRDGRLFDALEHYRQAVSANPIYIEARDNLASLLLDLRHYPEAEQQFREVLRLNPNLAETHCNLGSICLLTNRPAEAATHFEQALRLDPTLATAREGLAQIRQRGARP